MGISLSEIILILLLGMIFLKPKHISDTSYKIGKFYRLLLQQIIKIKKNINL